MATAEMMPTAAKAMHVEIPGMYWVESLLGETMAEMMPPIWPQLTVKPVGMPRLLLLAIWLTLG
jgi:hypothetical protein